MEMIQSLFESIFMDFMPVHALESLFSGKVLKI